MLGSPLDHFYQVLKMSAPRGKLCTVGFLFCSAAMVMVIVIPGCGQEQFLCSWNLPSARLCLQSIDQPVSNIYDM